MPGVVYSGTMTEFCGSPKRRGGTCQQPAGAGTDHLGSGRCKFHGGSSPAGKKFAAKEALRKGTAFYGDPVNVTPGEALLAEVRRTAGHVAFLEARVARADLAVVEGTNAPEDPKAVASRVEVLRHAYQSERKHLTQVCQVALHAGVEERAVRVAERWGGELANVLGAILADLQLSKTQQEKAPDIVARHLRVLEAA